MECVCENKYCVEKMKVNRVYTFWTFCLFETYFNVCYTRNKTINIVKNQNCVDNNLIFLNCFQYK